MMKEVAVQVQKDHLERITKVGKPIYALAELAWNGLDADATEVRVALDRNKITGLEAIRVADNGHGISIDEAETGFKNLGGSWKQSALKSKSGRLLHGKAGEGRFRAFALGERVIWDTTTVKDDEVSRQRIIGTRLGLGRFTIEDAKVTPKRRTGTEVTIENPLKNFVSLDGERAVQEFTQEFALYLREYPDVTIWYDGTRIDPAAAIARSQRYEMPLFTLRNFQTVEAALEVIEWKTQTERQLVLCDRNGFALSRKAPGIQAPGYSFTAYVRSDYFRELAKDNSLELDELHPDLRGLLDAAKAKLKEHFRKRAAEDAAGLVEEWKKENVYPYAGAPADILEETERQVFDVLALNLNEYLPEFDKSPVKTRRLSFRLLKQALVENPETLQRIFQDVLDLPKEKQEEFAELLHRTSLASIVSASKLIADRLDFLAGLECLIFDKKQELRERDQLHRLLAENTWVFGEEFNLSVDERSLDQVLQKHLALLGKRIDDDIPVLRTDGSVGRVDLMLSRRIPQPRDDEREHLVIELKRPSQPLTAAIATQIESYALAVATDERFRDTNTRWIFYAISNEVDEHVRRRGRQPNRPEGIIYVDEEFRITVWAKTWAQIFQQCRGRLEFFRKALQFSADGDAGLAYLRKTHEKYLPSSAKDGGAA